MSGAIANMRAGLRYRAYRGNDKLAEVIDALSKMIERLAEAQTIEQLMGMEGNARAWYFAAWKLVDEKLEFGPRVRRPPNNAVNCLISWFNGLAYTMAKHEIAKTHLDGCISFLHSPTETRHSLALDVSEPFKPALVDALIFEMALRDRLEPTWFVEADGICRLTEVGRKATLEAWVARTERGTGDKPGFRELMRAEALSVERHVLGIRSYSPWLRKV